MAGMGVPTGPTVLRPVGKSIPGQLSRGRPRIRRPLPVHPDAGPRHDRRRPARLSDQPPGTRWHRTVRCHPPALTNADVPRTVLATRYRRRRRSAAQDDGRRTTVDRRQDHGHPTAGRRTVDAKGGPATVTARLPAATRTPRPRRETGTPGCPPAARSLGLALALALAGSGCADRRDPPRTAEV